MSDSDLRRTPLHGRHLKLGAKMVPFAGFHMPVQYPTGITAEHQAVRQRSGLFDVSHMGEFEVHGDQALELVQLVTVNDVRATEPGKAQYSAMCREDGGILDDLIIYRFPDALMLVVNAANREKDLAWIREHADGLDAQVRDRSEETALLAIQGPTARTVVKEVTDHDVDAIGYYRFHEGIVAGVDAVISATGYTGEDGFELYVPADDAGVVWDALLEAGESHGLVPAGLGARDSLRLEVGYALYGNDLDEEHTPLEAGLGWITKLDRDPFVGREALRRQKEAGVERKLVGLRLTDRGFPRPGYDVVHGDRVVGSVTSGTVSPTLQAGIALAYVPASMADPGTELGVRIRDSAVPARVQKPPFYTDGSIRR